MKNLANRKFVVKIILSMVIIVSMTTLSSGVSADDGDDGQSMPYTIQVRASSGGSTIQGDWVESPSGCELIAQNPHRSNWWEERGEVVLHGKATARCRRGARVPQMSHTAQLWEHRFWGFDRIGTRGSYFGRWVTRGTATARAECVNNLTRTTGEGTIVDVDMRTYDAWDESAHIHNPCNLSSSSFMSQLGTLLK